MTEVIPAERWLPVVGHEGFYEVSDQGRVRSVDREIEKPNRWGGTTVCVLKGHLMATKRTKQGYARVSLSQEGTVRYARVHVLVLEAFVGPCPEGQQGLHGDDVGTNNVLSNLRWGTQAQNRRDCVRNGHHHYASRECCNRGHQFAGGNLRKTPKARVCRSCEWARPRATCESELQQLADRHYEEIMAGTKKAT